MSGRYAFTQSLKELRFLLCQTSEHSAATRFLPLPLFFFNILASQMMRFAAYILIPISLGLFFIGPIPL
jgi:hypothetical protein